MMVVLITFVMGSMTEICSDPALRIYGGYVVIGLYMLTAAINWVVVVARLFIDIWRKIRTKRSKDRVIVVDNKISISKLRN